MNATAEKKLTTFRVTGKNMFGTFDVMVEAKDAKHALEMVKEILARGLEVQKC